MNEFEKRMTIRPPRKGAHRHDAELGKFRPCDRQRFTFGMGRFKNGGGQNTVRAVYFDKAEIIRVE